MNIMESVYLAFAGLIANKMRALLTMLGIIIGIASVIAIVTLGDAMVGTVSSTLNDMGGNNIIVTLQEKSREVSGPNPLAGTRSAQGIDDNSLFTSEMTDKFMEVYSDQVNAISISEPVGSGTAKDGRKYANVNINGVNDGYIAANDITIIDGRFINARDLSRVANICVVSDKLGKTMFGNNVDPLGKEVKIHTTSDIMTYTIIGVYEYVDQFSAGMMTSADEDRTTDMYIPLSTAKKINRSAQGYGGFVVVGNPDVEQIDFAQDITDFFNRFYVNNLNYKCSATSMQSIIRNMSGVMSTVSVAVAIIAGISLLVGGIGVMNIMLVSITERTREIGTRKALGATNGSIRIQFIIESMVICLIGGMIGATLGVILGSVGAGFLGSDVSASLGSVLLSVGFSMLIGVFFGYYPANKAAKMDPIEALRYE